jgi:hypothetical protein
MGSLWRLIGWIALGVCVLAVGLAVTFFNARRRIMRRVEGELGREALLLSATARVSAGDDGAKPRASAAGLLMLLVSGLYFRSWRGGREVFIPGPSISWIGVSEKPGQARGERHRIVVRFLNASGKEDGISIRLLYPVQWVAAIKTHLITRAQ